MSTIRRLRSGFALYLVFAFTFLRISFTQEIRRLTGFAQRDETVRNDPDVISQPAQSSSSPVPQTLTLAGLSSPQNVTSTNGTSGVSPEYIPPSCDDCDACDSCDDCDSCDSCSSGVCSDSGTSQGPQ